MNFPVFCIGVTTAASLSYRLALRSREETPDGKKVGYL